MNIIIAILIFVALYLISYVFFRHKMTWDEWINLPNSVMNKYFEWTGASKIWPHGREWDHTRGVGWNFMSAAISGSLEGFVISLPFITLTISFLISYLVCPIWTCSNGHKCMLFNINLS